VAFSLWDLVGINWNPITLIGIIIFILIGIYWFLRITRGFVNPFNMIDKISLWVFVIDLIMVVGYSFMENLLYTTVGKVLFFSSLAIILAYFLLFYKVKGTKKVSKNKK